MHVRTKYTGGETRYNEILGTRKFCLLYQISCYISCQKQYKTKENNVFIGTGENSLLYQISCYIRFLYIEFPL